MRLPRTDAVERPGPYAFACVIGQSSTGDGFSNPVAIAVDQHEGMLYVASRRFARVCAWTRDGDYVGQFGRADSTDFSEIPSPDGEGVFWPSGIAHAGESPTGGCTAGTGVLYVTEEAHHRVRKFSASGEVVASWGGNGSAGRMPRGGSQPGQFNRPAGVAVGRVNGEDRVYVVDALNHRVQQFSPDGSLLHLWGHLGSGPGEFNLPWGVAVDSARDRVFVSDWRNDRIQQFDLSGRFVAAFGRTGTAPGELDRPAGIAVDPDGNVAVADWGNDRVLVLDPAGEPLAVLIGHGDQLSKAAQKTLASNEQMAKARAAYGGTHPLDRFFWAPTGVAFDAQGTLYAADTLRQRLQVYRRRN